MNESIDTRKLGEPILRKIEAVCLEHMKSCRGFGISESDAHWSLHCAISANMTTNIALAPPKQKAFMIGSILNDFSEKLKDLSDHLSDEPEQKGH